MRRWTAACAAALMGVVLVQPAAGQTTSLAGIIDFHVHSGPDSRPRSVGDLEIARIAKRAGMRGLVFKNHFTMTADRAWLAMEEVPGIDIFGGVALNHSVGGLNAEAVRQMVAFSGRARQGGVAAHVRRRVLDDPRRRPRPVRAGDAERRDGPRPRRDLRPHRRA